MPILKREANEGFARGLAHSFSIRGLGAALSFAVSVTLARLLGAEGYGAYAFVVGVVALLAIPVQAGVGTTVVKFTAAYEARKEWNLLKGLLQWATGVVGKTSIVCSVVAVAVFWLSPSLLPGRNYGTLLVGLAALPLIALVQVRSATLRGFRSFARSELAEAVIQPGVLLLLILAAWAAATAFGPSKVMVFYFFATAVALLALSGWAKSRLPREFVGAVPDKNVPAWIKTAAVVTITRGGRIAVGRLDLIVVGAVLGAEAAGVYRISQALVLPVSFGLNSVNVVAGPYFSKHHASGRGAAPMSVLLVSSAISTAVAAPAFVLLVLLGRPVLQMVYGSDFANAYVPLLVLAVGHFVNAVAGPVASLLTMTGQEKWTLAGVLLGGAVSVISYGLLVPALDITGAAIGTTAGLVVMNAFLAIKAWLRLVRSNSRSSERYEPGDVETET
jgi:O-antigen/teichoic acid export membrane protein